MKKILIIILILSVIGGGYYLYTQNTNQTEGATDSSTVSGFKKFLPFGQGKTNTQTTDTNTDTIVGQTNQTDTNIDTTVNKTRLRQINTFAVSGFTITNDDRKLPETTTIQITDPNNKTIEAPKPTVESVLALRYVRRSDGHMYEEFLDTHATGTVSNATIPGIYEAFFGNFGKSVIYRYLGSDNKNIQSFIGTLGTTAGKFLPENITDLSISPKGDSYFYLAPTGNDVSGMVANFNENKKTQLFTSPFTEWISDWTNNGIIFLTTKASFATIGYVYATNTKNGGLTKVFGGLTGLTTKTNNSGDKILYSKSTNNGPILGIYKTEDHSFADFPIKTLAEKCVWTKDDLLIYCAVPNEIEGTTYPDSWYRGEVSFNDSIYQVNPNTHGVIKLFDTTEENPTDATHLQYEDNTNTLFFINKKDSTLWSLDLNN